MKTSLKIFLLMVALIVMGGCSAQKRAERQVRRAVALCPELVQVKAHPIDTVLTAPAFVDRAALPLQKVLMGDTIHTATPHGTVVVSLCQSDSTLQVRFEATPQEIRYLDTLRYAQVTIEHRTAKKGAVFWSHFALCLIGLFVGMGLFCWLMIYQRKNK